MPQAKWHATAWSDARASRAGAVAQSGKRAFGQREAKGQPSLVASGLTVSAPVAARRLDDAHGLVERFAPGRDHRQAVGEEHPVERDTSEKGKRIEARRVADHGCRILG